MTARDVFEAMTPFVGPIIEREYGQRDLCILATRIAIEAAAYFGVTARPVPVQLIVYNAAFAKHMTNGFADVKDKNDPLSWGDDSYSVGVGFADFTRFNGWNGHLICMADGWFADYSIKQTERLEHGIEMPAALVGPYRGKDSWSAQREDGSVTAEYRLLENNDWLNAPDWREPKRRRKLAAQLIRALK